MEQLEQRLTDLKKQLGQASDLEKTKELSQDIANVERALELDRELRMGIGGPKPPVRVEQRAGLSDAEFRARAEKELAAVEVI